MPHVDFDLDAIVQTLLEHEGEPDTMPFSAGEWRLVPFAEVVCMSMVASPQDERKDNAVSIKRALASVVRIIDYDETHAAIPFVAELILAHAFRSETRSAVELYREFQHQGVSRLQQELGDVLPFSLELGPILELQRRAEAALAAANGDGEVEADPIMEAMGTIDRMVGERPGLLPDAVSSAMRLHFANLLMGVGVTTDALVGVT